MLVEPLSDDVVVGNHGDVGPKVYKKLLRLNPNFLLFRHSVGAIDGLLHHVIIVDDEGHKKLCQEETCDGEKGDEEQTLDFGAVLFLDVFRASIKRTPDDLGPGFTC